MKDARGGGMGRATLSVHKRATVHTPKRVFVRFHFTPNYLAHIGAHTVGEEGGEGVKRHTEARQTVLRGVAV